MLIQPLRVPWGSLGGSCRDALLVCKVLAGFLVLGSFNMFCVSLRRHRHHKPVHQR